MKRGDVWIRYRIGQENKVLVVGAEGLTAQRKGVLVVPISDVIDSDVIQPAVSDESGNRLGVAQIPRVGEVDKSYLTERVATLAPESVELVDMSLRVALAL
ncbi:type II toxin-antitoxin system PemK/MazF family toxin [Actinoplanes sp. TBRC 11911]|uniref:type II toxin-antitoxin system PemK/MazF family toxin n=1 Tax=Actinoplanes sp. TBRC 11911 TaxID=2729386 RepID=UPI00145F64E8|nr:type II toxin-antitoxin system PemK/MazF family toxin [Actinoplanes sp. TBRC 11911]NMO51967.1 type II toxin-antitoxin system PemK/MazF family toxin [Actinoplanes sp. TBRC 11911]